jgi:hypothetical protein
MHVAFSNATQSAGVVENLADLERPEQRPRQLFNFNLRRVFGCQKRRQTQTEVATRTTCMLRSFSCSTSGTDLTRLIADILMETSDFAANEEKKAQWGLKALTNKHQAASFT